jgi:DNA-binding XRE family transcriptional regulator
MLSQGENTMARKQITSASQILYRRLKARDPKLDERLARVREEASIARQIRALREARGLSQEQLARLIGTRKSAISRIEDADYDRHSMRMIRKVCAVLDARVHVEIVPLEKRTRAA